MNSLHRYSVPEIRFKNWSDIFKRLLLFYWNINNFPLKMYGKFVRTKWILVSQILKLVKKWLNSLQLLNTIVGKYLACMFLSARLPVGKWLTERLPVPEPWFLDITATNIVQLLCDSQMVCEVLPLEYHLLWVQSPPCWKWQWIDCFLNSLHYNFPSLYCIDVRQKLKFVAKIIVFL